MRAIVVLLSVALAATSAGAAESEAPDALYLDIPGLGRVPAPPGFRGDPRLPPPPPAQPQAKAPPPPPETREQTEARLFARLAAARDADEGQALAARALRALARVDSDTVALLTERAALAQAAGATLIAKALLDQVTGLAPQWAEGFVRRGRLREALGDSEGALRDLRLATALEPRRFDAEALIGALSESAGDKKSAREAFARSLKIAPMQDAVRKAHERLKLELDGRDI
jgi:tetratricopeptide (TPR) repeat protein